MKFIALFSLRENITQAKVAEAVSRRVEFKFPEGIQLLAEYWTPASDPAVIALFEATDTTALMANSVAWLDVFEVNLLPVVDWQEGAKKLSKLLPRK